MDKKMNVQNRYLRITFWILIAIGAVVLIMGIMLYQADSPLGLPHAKRVFAVIGAGVVLLLVGVGGALVNRIRSGPAH